MSGSLDSMKFAKVDILKTLTCFKEVYIIYVGMTCIFIIQEDVQYGI